MTSSSNSSNSKLLALLGLLAVAGYQNRDKLGQIFGGLLGNTGGVAPPPSGGSIQAGSSGSGGGGGFGDILGGIFGSQSRPGELGGGGLSEGLKGIVDMFTHKGQGDTANSWVGTGANKPVTPNDLGQVLDPETLQKLTEATGLSAKELLERLSAVLPVAVDKMTPQGRVPTADESSSWLGRA